MRLERIIHWQRSKCHFMVMQHSRFLIHCTQPRHLPWPRAGSSSQGHRGPWLAPLPSLLGSVPETQRTLQLPCWDRARDGSPPSTPSHLLPCLEHPNLAYPASPLPQHCPCPILTHAAVSRDPRQGSAAAHGERHLGSISRGTQLPGVIFHQRTGSEPCPSPGTLSTWCWWEP